MPSKHAAGGCGCCATADCGHCDSGSPVTVDFSSTPGGPTTTLSSTADPCKWEYVVLTEGWTLVITTSGGNRYARLVYSKTSPVQTVLWEANIEGLNPIDCCTDLYELELTCVLAIGTTCVAMGMYRYIYPVC
jgi:hypothetical protein